jgi:hypothetical protein
MGRQMKKPLKVVKYEIHKTYKCGETERWDFPYKNLKLAKRDLKKFYCCDSDDPSRINDFIVVKCTYTYYYRKPKRAKHV